MLDSMTGFTGVIKELKSESVKSEAELVKEFDELAKGEGLNKLSSSADPKDREHLNELWNAKYGKLWVSDLQSRGYRGTVGPTCQE